MLDEKFLDHHNYISVRSAKDRVKDLHLDHLYRCDRNYLDPIMRRVIIDLKTMERVLRQKAGSHERR